MRRLQSAPEDNAIRDMRAGKGEQVVNGASRSERRVTTAKSPKKPKEQFHDVSKLPDHLRKLVTEMFINGATYEDIVEALEDRGQETVSLRAVKTYFRASLDLQQQRIQRRLATVQSLKQALGDDTDSGQKELAEAVLLVGFMGLDRKSAEFDMQDAVREHGHRETFRLKSKKATMDEQIVETRLETERQKQELIQHKLGQLEKALHNANKGQRLGPEAFQKIKEIYGLISEPTAEAGE